MRVESINTQVVSRVVSVVGTGFLAYVKWFPPSLPLRKAIISILPIVLKVIGGHL